MTFQRLKTLAAALAVAAGGLSAGSATAAISDDNGGTPFTGTGAGELFLHAVSFTDNKSIIIDSGITAAAFRADPMAGWQFGVNPQLANFIATATGPIVYNIGAVHNGDFLNTLDPNVWGILASTAGPINTDPTLLGFNAIVASMGTHADHLLNVNGVSTNVAQNNTKLITDPAAPDFWWGNSAGQLGFDNTAAIDQPLLMVFVMLNLDPNNGGADDGSRGFAMNVQPNWAWRVDLASGNVAFQPVPLPAAAWLLGSALAGMAFRRKNKQ